MDVLREIGRDQRRNGHGARLSRKCVPGVSAFVKVPTPLQGQRAGSSKRGLRIPPQRRPGALLVFRRGEHEEPVSDPVRGDAKIEAWRLGVKQSPALLPPTNRSVNSTLGIDPFSRNRWPHAVHLLYAYMRSGSIYRNGLRRFATISPQLSEAWPRGASRKLQEIALGSLSQPLGRWFESGPGSQFSQSLGQQRDRRCVPSLVSSSSCPKNWRSRRSRHIRGRRDGRQKRNFLAQFFPVSVVTCIDTFEGIPELQTPYTRSQVPFREKRFDGNLAP